MLCLQQSGDVSSSSKFEVQLPPEWVDKMGNVTADAKRIESKCMLHYDLYDSKQTAFTYDHTMSVSVL